ncbi:MAG: hypothetical protein JWN84_1642 [Nocardioides sp.]|nr:hypothetical protein [Nocardioides sp.]
MEPAPSLSLMANGPLDFDNPAHRPLLSNRTPFAAGEKKSFELVCSCGNWTHPRVHFVPAQEQRVRTRALRKHAAHAGSAERRRRAGLPASRDTQPRSSAKLAMLTIAAVAVVAAVTVFLGTRGPAPGDVAYGPGWNGEALELSPTSASQASQRTRAPSRQQRTQRPQDPQGNRSAAPSPQPVPQPLSQSSVPGLPQSIVEEVARVGEQTGYTLPGSAPDDAAILAVAVCELVADGSTTFEGEYDEAVATGAPAAAAERWNTYVEFTVCPALG